MNNKSEFTYGPTGGRVKIVETVSGSVTSTKQFIGGEERDGGGSVTKQFFSRGQRNGSTNYFYAKDHLGSIRVMTDDSGVVQASYAFSPYGQSTKLSGGGDSDIGFAGMYLHSRSGLNLSATRGYAPSLGRWISRDPAGAGDYAYAGNDPSGNVDPLGLDWVKVLEAPILGTLGIFWHLGFVVEIDDSAGNPTYYTINGLPKVGNGLNLELRITSSTGYPDPPLVNSQIGWAGSYGPNVVDDDSCQSESLAKRVLNAAQILQKSLASRPLGYSPLPFWDLVNSNMAFGAILKSSKGRVEGTLPKAPGYNFNLP